MSSPSRPSRFQRPLHNFKLPSHLKWSTKRQSTSNSSRRRGFLPRSSSSLGQNLLSDKSASSSQSTGQGSIPLRFKFSISTSGSNTQAPSSFHPCSAIESGFSPQGTSTATGFDVVDKEANAINYLVESGRDAGRFDEQKMTENMQVDSSLKVMTENFDKLLSASGMNEEDQEEKDRKEVKKEKKPSKKFGSTDKKKLRKVKDIPPVVALENKESTSWSFQRKMHSENSRILDLEKVMGSSYGNQGEPAQENKGKQIKATGKSKQGSIVGKNKNGHEKEKKKKQQTEIELPKFSRQLTPQEIAVDIFTMTGARPSTKPKRRTKKIQKNVDQVTPGLWLESIDVERYAVRQNVGKST